MDKNKLFVIPKPISNPSLRLFCFPFAGGTVVPYTSWPHLLNERVEVVIIQFPGRGSRITEKPHQCMASMMNELKQYVDFITELPYILFGHSFGSRVAFELCCRLMAEHKRLPCHFIASASRAAHLPINGKSIENYTDRDFIAHIVGPKNIPQEVLSNIEVMELLMPVLRADFSVAGRHVTDEIKMPFPILALYGKDDSGIKEAGINQWSKLTSVNFKKVEIPGGHFFISQYRDKVLSQINHIMNVCIRNKNLSLAKEN